MRIFAVLLAAVAALAQPRDPKVFETLSFRAVGPTTMGGRVSDIEGVPGNPNVVYVGTGGGGLWKTLDGGMTWASLFDDKTTISVGDLALDPRNPEVVWLGTGEANMRNSVSFGDGVYKSTDGGKSWKHIGLADTEHIARVLVNPLDPEVAYVCAVGHQSGPNEERGVFMTTDGGKTWQRTLFVDSGHGCADLEINPKNPNVLYAAMWRFERKAWNHTSGSEKSGVFRSTDGGRTWKKLEKGLPKLIGRVGVKVAPSNPSVVYLAAESKEGTLYRSTDGGDTFAEMTRAREVVARGFYYADLRVDPVEENRVYAVASLLQISTDAGKTFKATARGIHIDFHSLWIDPLNPARMWAGSDGGISLSNNRGDSWESILNIPLAQYYAIHADNRLPFYSITGGLQDNGTWTGPSRTRTGGIAPSDWKMVTGGDGFFATVHPDNPNVFLTESQGGRLSMTNIETGEQQAVAPQPQAGRVGDLKYRFNWNTPIVTSPHGGQTVFFGGSALFQTRNFGRAWEPISPDLTRNIRERMKSAGGPIWYDNSTAENHGTIVSIGESPAKAGVVWVGTDDGNVQVTPDSGKTWNNVVGNLPKEVNESWVSHVEPSRTNATTAYVALDRHFWDDYGPHIFKTTDTGKTFARVTNGLPAKAYVHVVREDPKNPQLLYAGTEMGLFVSWNAGGSWQRLAAKNLPNVAIHDIVVHARENDLILGTHGRSILILDDIAALQQPPGEGTKLYAPRVTYRFANRGAGGGMDDGGSKVFKGANPRYGAPITFSVAGTGTAKVEIVDASGKVIREVSEARGRGEAAPAAGLRRLVWDLRHEGPKIRRAAPEGAEEGPGVARGPKAAPGIYTVRLTVGTTKLEEKFEVRLDPGLTASAAELQEQLTYGLKVRDMQSEVNTTLKTIDGLKDQIRAMETRGRAEAGLRGQLGPLADWQKALDQQTLKIGLPATANRLEDAPGLAERLVNLGGIIDGPNAAPLPQQVAHFAEVEKEYNDNLPGVKAFLRAQVPVWNAVLTKLNLGTLPIPR
jgi:photosystem II stability/assembly factor-like uncharacterized protein